MDLHSIVRGPITMVTPDVAATLVQNVGTTTVRGVATPLYNRVDVQVQVQPASSDDIQHAESLNIQGIKKVAFLHGEAAVIIRANQTGGDLLEFGGQTWRVVISYEQWPDWCKIGLVLQ